MIVCPVCGHSVPPGEFCGACGAHLSTGSAGRMHYFAADPHEHVLQPNIVTTLFPHLQHRATAPFRVALFVVGLLLLVLGLFRLTGPAIAAAALAMPLLYAIYIYETDVFRDDPVIVAAATFGLGLLLGIPWSLYTGPIVTNTLLHDLTIGPTARDVVGSGVLVPLGSFLLMLIGPLVLYARGRAREPLDGFVFGAASALGFTLSSTLIDLAPQLQNGLVSHAPLTTNALDILTRGLLVPFLNAASTGLLAAALWSRRLNRRDDAPAAWTTAIVPSLLLTAVVRVVVGLFAISVLSTGVVVTVLLALTLGLMVWVRAAMHHMLLVQAARPEVGDHAVCYGCHRIVPGMAFCPACGLATSATPRRVPPTPREAVWEPGHYPPAGSHALQGLRKSASAGRSWAAAGSLIVVAMIALGITALVTAPSTAAACRVFCHRPPPPCFGVSCSRAFGASSVTGQNVYTSSTYGFSLSYPPDLPPTRSDNSSVGWDLQNSDGQYEVDVVSGSTKGRSAQEIALDIQQGNFPDYQQVYDVPGAEIGYQEGYGSVWELQVLPLFGQSEDTRLLIMTAEQNGVAIALAADGPAVSPDSGHPDPSGLPLGSFADDLANSVHWHGGTAP